MSEEFSSLWEHVAELRQTLIRSFFIILCGVAISLYFHQEVFQVLTLPLKQSAFDTSTLNHQEIRRERIVNNGAENSRFQLPTFNNWVTLSTGAKRIDSHTILLPPGAHAEYEHYVSTNRLLVLSPLEGMLISFKASFWIGLVGTSPLWIFVLLKFISPALRTNEKRLIWPFLGLSFSFVLAGLAFAFFLTIPLANQYLYAFNGEIGTNLWSLSNYVNYTLFLLLANAAAFEMGLVLFFLVHCRFLTAEQMRSKRRHMIVVAFILGALLTPPDVLTQFMLAIPLICLYELAILYACLRARKVILVRPNNANS
jgi:sec-independent protein translocase protein TatC